MYCQKCKVENPDYANYCQECGTQMENEPKKDPHGAARFIGIVGLLIFMPMALIAGIYLMSREDKKAKKTGGIILGIALTLILVYSIIIITHR